MKVDRAVSERESSHGRHDGPQTAPAVTILMSVYNGERFVSQALESILRQTWTDFEFLIINDCSHDRTREIIASFRDTRIRLLDNPVNLGLAKSLNVGLAQARGSLVARQDADDISHPERLREQVEFMRSNPDIALVGTQVHVIDERGRVKRRPGWERALNGAAIRFQLMFDNAFIHTSVMFRREIIWNHLGGYDEQFAASQDFELWSRVAASYAVCNLPRRLADYRFYASSTGALYRRNHLAQSRAVVAANLCRYLKLERVHEEWPRLISSMHVNPSPGRETELIGLAAAADEIYRRFLECHPEESANHEIRKVLAAKMAQVACRLAVSKRSEALRVFTRARALNAATASSFALKFFSLLLFGERLRVLATLYARHGLNAL